MGNIGEERRRIDVLPLHEPAREPAPTTAPAQAPSETPAHAPAGPERQPAPAHTR